MKPFRKAVPPDPLKKPPVLCPGLHPVSEAHRNPYFKVMDRGTYFTLEYDVPQVVVLPVVERDSVILVRVWRPVIDDYPLELPAGGAAEGETPLNAVLREFGEETGIRIQDVSRFRPILPLSESPGRMPELLSIFRIDLTEEEWLSRGPTDTEILSVHRMDRGHIREAILSGEIYLSSPLAILARFLLE